MGADCNWMPALCNKNTNAAADPSRIGTSSAVMSTTRLSSPRPEQADSRCSTVLTFGPPGSPPGDSVVAMRVSHTAWARAGMSTAMGRSTRRNTTPESGGAGRKRQLHPLAAVHADAHRAGDRLERALREHGPDSKSARRRGRRPCRNGTCIRVKGPARHPAADASPHRARHRVTHAASKARMSKAASCHLPMAPCGRPRRRPRRSSGHPGSGAAEPLVSRPGGGAARPQRGWFISDFPCAARPRDACHTVKQTPRIRLCRAAGGDTVLSLPRLRSVRACWKSTPARISSQLTPELFCRSVTFLSAPSSWLWASPAMTTCRSSSSAGRPRRSDRPGRDACRARPSSSIAAGRRSTSRHEGVDLEREVGFRVRDPNHAVAVGERIAGVGNVNAEHDATGSAFGSTPLTARVGARGPGTWISTAMPR